MRQLEGRTYAYLDTRSWFEDLLNARVTLGNAVRAKQNQHTRCHCRYAGHTVFLSGVTLVVAYVTLLFFPVNFIQVSKVPGRPRGKKFKKVFFKFMLGWGWVRPGRSRYTA
jgi:hypothetical protein